MTSQEQCVEVGAYVLGVLDPADAAHFEAHLTYCAKCQAGVEEFAGLPSILSEVAKSSPDMRSLTPQPSKNLQDRLVGEVVAKRQQDRRKRLYLVAAAAVLIIGGPVGAVMVSSDSPKNPVDQVLAQGERHTKTDPDTKAKATVGVAEKMWGTQVGLRLGGIKGPLKCDLVAVSKTGEEQTVSTWSVPKWGYGVDGRPELEIAGGAAMKKADIDRLEVRTLEGDRLVSVPVQT